MFICQDKTIRLLTIIFSVVIFVVSFLSFSVQPLFSKLLLPNFGGSAMVWTTSSLFFQVLLLCSYSYVFLLEKLSWRYHFLLHISISLIILLASVTTQLGTKLSFTELPRLIGTPSSANEVLQIIKVGTFSLGTTFFFLGTVSTSLQVLAAKVGIKNPYLFYRASNTGSLVGLFSFPLIIEPFIPSNLLVNIWASLATTIIGTILLLYLLLHHKHAVKSLKNTTTQIPSYLKMARWSLFAAFPVALFLAVTNQITLGVAPIPYLWILPFGVYLFSYILAFGIYKREPLLIISLTVLGSSGLLSLAISQISLISYLLQIGILLLVTFIAALLAHSLAYETRPNKSQLSYFYLSLAFGGMLGGLAISVLAPLIFNTYLELELLLVTAIVISIFYYAKQKPVHILLLGSKRYISANSLGVMVTGIIVSYIVMKIFTPGANEVIYRSRNFYGTLKISQNQTEKKLSNGTVLHGSQFLDHRSVIPTTYYSPNSGVGKTMQYFQNKNDKNQLRVGVIGLGTGSVASYCRPNDQFVFFEINEQVVQVAQDHFSYVQLCKDIDIKIGDARMLLNRESFISEDDKYDVLIVDAFTDDAIPTHLLTIEAGELYLDAVKNEGAVLYHISNRYLDLEKVLAGMAKEIGAISKKLSYVPNNDAMGEIRSEWVLITKSEAVTEISKSFEQDQTPKESVLWTDNYSNILKVVRWW